MSTVYGPDELLANAGGPYHATPDEFITFAGSATGGVDPYGYEWDFGDGSTGYGQVTYHKYDGEGTYTVRLTVTDSEGNSDEQTSTVTITEDHGTVEIKDIKGGLGVKATIVTGDSPVDWTIDIEGRYIFVGGHASGTTEANAEETVRMPFSLGFGDVDITITAGALFEQHDGFMIGPFVMLR
jgi:PKD repeat protein